VVIHCVDTDGIVDHNRLNFPFIKLCNHTILLFSSNSIVLMVW